MSYSDVSAIDARMKKREDGYRDEAITVRDDQLKRLTAMRQADLSRAHMGQGDPGDAPAPQAIPFVDGQSEGGAGSGSTPYLPLIKTKPPVTPDQYPSEMKRLTREQIVPNPDEAGLAALSRIRRAQGVGGKVDPADEKLYGEYVARQRRGGWKGPAQSEQRPSNMQAFQALMAQNDTRTEANPNPSPAEDARFGRVPAPAQGAGGSQYDKPTPYDGLINQAAQQNGIDPVMFKRLLGTESSFNPNATGAMTPQGQAHGIAQIMTQIHNVSPEQARDPAFAIPFAAKLLADNIRAAGGDPERALQMYKGAKSDSGKAAMAPAIAKILGGAPPTPSTSGGPVGNAYAATVQQFTPEQFFSAAPQVDQQMRMAQLRLTQLREMASVVRDPVELQKMHEQVTQLQVGMQEAQTYRLAAQAAGGNEGALSQLVQMMGGVGVARTSQGYVMVDPASGRAMSQPMSAGELAKTLYGNVSASARAQAAESAKKRGEIAAETEGKVAIEGVKNQGAQQLEEMKANAAIREAILKNQLSAGDIMGVETNADTRQTIVRTKRGVFAVATEDAGRYGKTSKLVPITQ
jgi:soluble lytic murein transglycosylase-like protein